MELDILFINFFKGDTRMENINFKIAEVDAALTYYLQQLPVGVAYYILKDKVKLFEGLYINQANK
jgi:hypothetical protein